MKVAGVELIEGKIYTFKRAVETRDGRRKGIRHEKTRERLVRCYPHHAVFENETGAKRSYQYWDLEQFLSGELKREWKGGAKDGERKRKVSKYE